MTSGGADPRGDPASERRPRFLDPRELRSEIRAGRWTTTTADQAPGHAQANVVVLPRDLAFDFLVFALRNPKPCPVLEVLEAGDPVPRLSAPEADLRTDVPAYRIYERGAMVDEVSDIGDRWQDDAVGFLLGCSFTFEEALVQAGIPMRHHEVNCTVPMYRTRVPTRPAGIFRGRMVVSMRPIAAGDVSRAVQVTSRFPAVHGAPVPVGAPEELGIADLDRPDYGDPVPIKEGEVPVFWGCGVTPQSVALEGKPEWMITHSPGRMFVSDVPNQDLDVLGGSFPDRSGAVHPDL
ncbi:MAG: putative hydro-lyase [Actinomycetota bacterium]